MRELITQNQCDLAEQGLASEAEPDLRELEAEHLPLLRDLIREHRAMLEERQHEQMAADSNFRQTMYSWARSEFSNRYRAPQWIGGVPCPTDRD